MPEHARCPSGAAPDRTEPGLEVAEIFRRAISDYKQKYTLGPAEARIARDVMACRTAVLGGHVDVCAACGHERPAYNSCRNRHCPKCLSLQSARWVAGRMDRVLPVHYFHVVFTLPGDLRELAARNPALLFDLLLKSAAEALLALGRDPKWFGRPAQLGITAVLHTWARDLHLHPHVHCIVTGGGLTSDGSGWVAAPKDFLFPVHVLGALFRGKFLAGPEPALSTSRTDTVESCRRRAPRPWREQVKRLARSPAALDARHRTASRGPGADTLGPRFTEPRFGPGRSSSDCPTDGQFSTAPHTVGRLSDSDDSSRPFTLAEAFLGARVTALPPPVVERVRDLIEHLAVDRDIVQVEQVAELAHVSAHAAAPVPGVRRRQPQVGDRSLPPARSRAATQAGRGRARRPRASSRLLRSGALLPGFQGR